VTGYDFGCLERMGGVEVVEVIVKIESFGQDSIRIRTVVCFYPKMSIIGVIGMKIVPQNAIVAYSPNITLQTIHRLRFHRMRTKSMKRWIGPRNHFILRAKFRSNPLPIE